MPCSNFVVNRETKERRAEWREANCTEDEESDEMAEIMYSSDTIVEGYEKWWCWWEHPECNFSYYEEAYCDKGVCKGREKALNPHPITFPISNEEEAFLFAKKYMEENNYPNGKCDVCKPTNAITKIEPIMSWPFEIPGWRMGGVCCACSMVFGVDGSHVSLHCFAAPECGQEMCFTNEEMNCSTDSDCKSWRENATCCEEGICCECERMTCCQPCLKLQ